MGLIHKAAHFDALLAESPLVAVEMGLPPFFLARRRSLEAAMAFHWIQDVAQFVAGF